MCENRRVISKAGFAAKYPLVIVTVLIGILLMAASMIYRIMNDRHKKRCMENEEQPQA